MARKKLRNGFVLIWFALFGLQTQICLWLSYPINKKLMKLMHISILKQASKLYLKSRFVTEKAYTWPMWNRSKNRKLQVLRERTTHPDAQWWPEADSGFSCIGGL